MCVCLGQGSPDAGTPTFRITVSNARVSCLRVTKDKEGNLPSATLSVAVENKGAKVLSPRQASLSPNGSQMGVVRGVGAFEPVHAWGLCCVY
jgi:hypothetical protein